MFDVTHPQKSVDVSITRLPAAFALEFDGMMTPMSIQSPDTTRLNKMRVARKRHWCPAPSFRSIMGYAIAVKRSGGRIR